ncbi:MAG: 50S ribosomal protein L25 [Pseudomonas sp.]|uniref:50S ribosomal protein L25 n=1 Tax=Geopseudomonas guangdongensis TaxID=1245526 RepID=A0A1H2G0W9_9GAMM|nr:50S ribosomal protein L25 [Pseudomonas sp.]SDU13140.1 large subunit ribosomal protein L25 [Pseudomonas guangdongensis]
MTNFTLNAQARSDLGKGASRRLRRNANLVPAVVYGGEQAPQSICMEAREVVKLLEDQSVFGSTVALNIDGAVQNVVIKAVQRHPSKGFALHMDFVRA